ncbi:MAG: hypothetical protein ACKVH8_12990 [Pirellulales bacterium]
MQTRMFTLFTLSVLCLSLAGCGSDLSGLTGTITIDGNPAPKGLSIEFSPVDPKGLSSYASTDENGYYEAAFTFKTKGIQPGEYTVRLMPKTVEPSMPVIGPDGKPVAEPPKKNPIGKLPRAYYDEIQKVTVDSGSMTLDIELTTEK